MKKLVLLFALCVVVFCGCATNSKDVEYVKAVDGIDIFSCFDEFGGKVEGVELKMNGCAIVKVKFQEKQQIDNSIEKINIKALDEERYNDGKRVIDIKSVNENTAKIYIYNVNYLKSQDIKYYTAASFQKDYADNYKNTEFADVKGEKVDISKFTDKQGFYVVENLPAVTVLIEGKLVCSTTLGLEKVSADSLLYATQDAVIVIEKSSAIVVTIIVVSAVIILALVFVFLIKMRLFTKLKMKKAKTYGEN